MGNIPQVQCHPDKDSPSDPGFKCVLSESLEKYCTGEEFYDGLWEVMRAPISPQEQYILKELSCIDGGPEEFTVKVVFDGQKLKYYGLSPDETDHIRLHQKVVGNRKEQMIVAQTMKHDVPVSSGFARILRDPARVEFYEIVDGERRSGKRVTWMLQNCYVTPVLLTISKRKVKVVGGHESGLQGGGPSAISDPLDEYLTFDVAYDLFLDCLREPPPMVHDQAPVVTDTEDGFEVKLPEQEHFKELCAGRDPSLGSMDTTMLVRHDRDKGEIIVVFSVGQELLYTSFIHFHRYPLRIESWQVTGGKRLGGTQERNALQGYVDMIISRSEGKEGWYF
mmetsp:Transcript_77448/g.240686  ORF Transcript_77448/g.240686 Transcript_77448/m.240686 type:complete len:336 (-) Transcript_77448:82-1089(-)